MSNNLHIEILTGSDIAAFTSELAYLRIEIFREFPYLYDGSLEYERNYLKTYSESSDSLAVIVFDGEKPVGVSTGLPMDHETEEFKHPFIEEGYNPNNIFYCGESILKKEYRGRGFYSRFFKEREDHAKKLGRFDIITFCAVVRPNKHPLKPVNYRPLDPIWKKFGYTKHPELTTTYTWKDVNEEKESPKKMVFWLKEL
ncbi:MAG: GNAT family N-acetyltransferase [Balneolaceae bacterium]|nr:MAG: GNAT family N-acetyltransferase [Balneolaceae bacterium]